MRPFSAEPTLIVQAVRRNVDRRLVERCAAGVDWEQAAALARDHRVTPLVVRGLAAANVTIPHAMTETARRSALRGLVMTAELIRVSDALERRGVRCLAVKGPVQGALVYGNSSLRSFGDLDLVVHHAQVREAAECLAEAGYGLVDDATLSSHIGQAGFRNAARGVFVDLHWRFTASAAAFPLSMDEALARRVAVPLAGATVYTLPPTDRLLFLCVHGGRHRWERLSWLCDVAWELSGGFHDAPAVLARARALGVVRPLRLAASLAHELLGAPQLLADDRLPMGLRLLARHARAATALRPASGDLGVLASFLGYLALHDSWHSRSVEIRSVLRRRLARRRAAD